MRAGVKHVEAMSRTGVVMGVDAIVPPMPVRDIGHAALNGALRVIEQLIGIVAANGVVRADLRGGPTYMTKGIFGEEVVLCLRSD